MASCLLSLHQCPSEKGSTLNGKNYFLLVQTPFRRERNNLGRVASPENPFNRNRRVNPWLMTKLVYMDVIIFHDAKLNQPVNRFK